MKYVLKISLCFFAFIGIAWTLKKTVFKRFAVIDAKQNNETEEAEECTEPQNQI